MRDARVPMDDLELRHPEIFRQHHGIRAAFTDRSLHANPGGMVPGLNFGTNTKAPAQEIDRSFDLLRQADPIWARRAWVRQVHGRRVVVAEQPGEQGEADGLVTRIPGLSLSIQVADCAAILLADPVGNVVAAIHAGWRGAAAGIVRESVHRMRELGADPSRIVAWVSPCISQTRFEVGEEVASRFDPGRVDRTRSKPHVDLKGSIADQLESEGIAPSRLDVDPSCTVEDPDRFHSFRRDGDRSGRMLAIIALEPLPSGESESGVGAHG